MTMSKKKKVLLAFSGGLDTSAIVPWLIENHSADVIAYCSDLGNAPDERHLQKWAKELGAVDFIFEDVRDRFAADFAFKAVRAGAAYQDDYLLGTSLGRPLIAERMAFFAKKLGATAIAHGATGKGNDQLRFEKSWAYLLPEAQVIAPWKAWDFKGRQDLLKYLAGRGFNLTSAEKLYSVDVNLFHRSCEGGILEDPAKEYDPAKIYEWVAPPAKQSKEAIAIAVEFAQGLPVALNGKKLGPADLLGKLNAAAGEAGIGVADMVEERANGIKSRGVYETPGGTLLHIACRSLKHVCWDCLLLTMARAVGQHYGELIYDGLWHSDARLAAESYFAKAAETLNGKIHLKLEGGQARVVARESDYALYDKELVSFEGDQLGIHKFAEGYSKTVSFPSWRAGRRDVKTGRNQRV
jgi:argininosuccinate synthase